MLFSSSETQVQGNCQGMVIVLIYKNMLIGPLFMQQLGKSPHLIKHPSLKKANEYETMCIKYGPCQDILVHLRILLLIISRKSHWMELLDDVSRFSIDPDDFFKDENTIIEHC